MNPNRLSRTIEDGDVRLWEFNVIVRYSRTTLRCRQLCPADIATRFDAERWMDWQATAFWPVLTPLFIALDPDAATERNAAISGRAFEFRGSDTGLKAGRRGFSRRRRVYDGRYTCGGDGPSLVRSDIEHLELPNVIGWYERVTSTASRPS